MNSIRFITGQPALLAGRALVVTDLHLGIEREFYGSGIKFPSQTSRIMESIDALAGSTGAERLIILGDVKHKVPGISVQELREIPEFLKHFSERMKVDVILGNHDAGIEDFAPGGVTMHPGSGFSSDGFYFTHGHAWPEPGFLGCSHVIAGHHHPFVEFRDRLGYRFREAVWARGALRREPLSRKFGKLPRSIPEAVFVPAFSHLAGGAAINGAQAGGDAANFIGPLMKSADQEKLKVSLLDGTYLGTLAGLRKAKL